MIRNDIFNKILCYLNDIMMYSIDNNIDTIYRVNPIKYIGFYKYNIVNIPKY